MAAPGRQPLAYIPVPLLLRPLHCLEHSVRDDAEDVGNGEERDAEAAHPFSGRRQVQLRLDNAKWVAATRSQDAWLQSGYSV